MSFTNGTNGTMTDDQNNKTLIELILPLVVWTGMGICEIILSTLVIVAITINKELHNIQYFFIANLMICDIISSFTVNFMVTGITINSLIDSKSKGANCKMVDTLYFPFTTSFLMVTVLIFDRFLIIVFPFSYHKIMTNKVVIGFVAGSWLIGFILCSFALFDPEHEGKYTRNGFCHTDTILSRLIAIVFPNVVATFLAVIQIAYLSFKAHKLAREHQHRQSLSGEKIKEIALSSKGIWTLILLVGVAGVLGVIIPIILGLTRILVGNETTAAKIIQNGVVPFFGKMPTIAHSFLYGFHLTDLRNTIFKIVKCLMNCFCCCCCCYFEL